MALAGALLLAAEPWLGTEGGSRVAAVRRWGMAALVKGFGCRPVRDGFDVAVDTILFYKAHSSRLTTSRIRCFVVVCFRDLGQQLAMECSPLPCCPRATAHTASVRAEDAYGLAMNRVPGGSSLGIRPDAAGTDQDADPG